MKIKDRYIAKTLFTYSLVVLLVWLGIYSFFNFLAELNTVGKVDYTILEAIKYIVLQIPEVAYKQVSSVILLGCVLGMGHLATTGQLLVLRVSGVSILKITWLTIKNAFILLALLIVVGETVAPVMTEFAEDERARALGKNNIPSGQDGFWIKDGDSFINVNNSFNGSLFNGITVIDVNESYKINGVIRSKSGIFDGQSINMDATNVFSVNPTNQHEDIVLKKQNFYKKYVSFDQDLIDSLEKEPQDLSTLTLINQIQFLIENKLRAKVFEVELYKRLVKPLTLGAMILLAMLFIFGSMRDVTLGRKIFFGVAIALSFELVSRVGAAIALSFEFSPLLITFAPPLTVIVITIAILINKSINASA